MPQTRSIVVRSSPTVSGVVVASTENRLSVKEDIAVLKSGLEIERNASPAAQFRDAEDMNEVESKLKK